MNLKGGGQLTVKTGNGEQMCGMVTGLGSVTTSVPGTDRRIDVVTEEDEQT